jgi:hypothetical protein
MQVLKQHSSELCEGFGDDTAMELSGLYKWNILSKTSLKNKNKNHSNYATNTRKC